MSASQRRKGKAGELEAARVLAQVFDLDVRPQRQLSQPRDSGSDLAPAGTPLEVEVKRRKTLKTLMGWLRQTERTMHRPVQMVMCRQDNGPWLFVLDAPAMIALVGWLRRSFTGTRLVSDAAMQPPESGEVYEG